jgi:hypothetical protein
VRVTDLLLVLVVVLVAVILFAVGAVVGAHNAKLVTADATTLLTAIKADTSKIVGSLKL